VVLGVYRLGSVGSTGCFVWDMIVHSECGVGCVTTYPAQSPILRVSFVAVGFKFVGRGDYFFDFEQRNVQQPLCP
jgi:hypothetical protein